MTSAILPSANGNPVTGSNLNPIRRSSLTVAKMERYAMHAGSIHIAHVHANERRIDLLVEAAHARRVNEAVQGNGSRLSVAGGGRNLAHNVGVLLVRAGQRLQQPATDHSTPIGTLHTAR